MNLRVVGAGLPRTGTSSLRQALERLLGGRCYHMSVIPGHPFDLGAGWNRPLVGDTPDWNQLLEGYIATVDWPASMFWRELSEANPDALVLLSMRDTAEVWWQTECQRDDSPCCAHGPRAGLEPRPRASGPVRTLHRDKALGRPDDIDGGLQAAQC